MPYMPTKSGGKCVFPFLYGGVEYTVCTGTSVWCATTYDYDTDAEWDYCDPENEVTCEGEGSTTAEPVITTVLKSTTTKATTITMTTVPEVATTLLVGSSSCVPEIPTEDGELCSIPFLYNGQLMTTCVTEFGSPWCSLTPDFDEDDSSWAYCDLANAKLCEDSEEESSIGQTTRSTTAKTTTTAAPTTTRAGDETTQCVPQIVTSSGEMCQIPFSYGGTEYNGCVTEFGSTWCSLTYEYDVDGLWGYCDLENSKFCEELDESVTSDLETVPQTSQLPRSRSTAETTESVVTSSESQRTNEPDDGENTSESECVTQIPTTDGRMCMIPFIYEGQVYSQCVSPALGAPWCSLTFDYDTDGEYAYCDLANAVICDDSETGTEGDDSSPTTSEPTKTDPPLTSTVRTTKAPTEPSTSASTQTPTLPTTPSKCVTKVFTTEGKKCRIPFRVKGRKYYGCIPENDKSWCSLSFDFDRTGRRGYCDMSTAVICGEDGETTEPTIRSSSTQPSSTASTLPASTPGGPTGDCTPEIPTTDGKVCVFPFTYRGVEYNECVDGEWCAVTPNYDVDGLWGYCDLVNAITCKQASESPSSTVETTRKPRQTTTPQSTTVQTTPTTRKTRKPTTVTTTTASSTTTETPTEATDGSDECVPQMPTKDGQTCVFPFIYNGDSYNTCIDDEWCATTNDYDTDGLYGYCDFDNEVVCLETTTKKPLVSTRTVDITPSRVTSTTEAASTAETDAVAVCVPKMPTQRGSFCHFPFGFSGRVFYECVPAADNTAWCSTTADYERDKRWDYCLLDKQVTCPPEDTTTPVYTTTARAGSQGGDGTGEMLGKLSLCDIEFLLILLYMCTFEKNQILYTFSLVVFSLSVSVQEQVLIL